MPLHRRSKHRRSLSETPRLPGWRRWAWKLVKFALALIRLVALLIDLFEEDDVDR